jgi:hypothetical protein
METRDFEVTIRTFVGEFVKPTNPIKQPVAIFTTNPAQPEIRLGVEGTVRGAAGSASSGS